MSRVNLSLIAQHWFRNLCGDDTVSIEDISKIIHEFGAEIEKFDASWTHKSLE